MNKEEIEELKDFTIDLTDIDELALGLEVCSKKSNMVIQEFADTIIQLQQENKQLNQLLKDKGFIINKLMEENRQLKGELEKIKQPTIFIDTQDMEERYAEGLYQEHLEKENIKYKNQQKKFIKYLENEKDRLARECSQIYEDSLGKTRLVNEDIFNEVDTILSKYKEIIGGIK